MSESTVAFVVESIKGRASCESLSEAIQYALVHDKAHHPAFGTSISDSAGELAVVQWGQLFFIKEAA
jgi:hypothetical protein